MCELLAPAGNAESFDAALRAGADAVYIGLREFSAREAAENFTLSALAEAAGKAHLYGAKVYAALNTLVKDAECGRFLSLALDAWNAGADALILQDPYLGRALKDAYPEMILHLSTQAGVCNAYGARLAAEFGFSRVIASRETPLSGVAAIAETIETEVFVQGAMCTCFSGQCTFSAHAGGNSGNRGRCKQPCRRLYSISRPGYEDPAYSLSLSDLSLGKEIRALAARGVRSFKIEGRMRSAAYVGAAVRYYRDILDGNDGALEKDFSALSRAYNRGGYTCGYLYGQDKNLLSRDVQGHAGEKVGTVASFSKDGNLAFVAVSRTDYSPAEGDGFKILRGGREAGGAVWTKGFGKTADGFFLPAKDRRRGDEVRLTSDRRLAEETENRQRKIPVFYSFTAGAGIVPRAETVCGNARAAAGGTVPSAPAKTAPLTERDVEICFSKTDGLPFSPRKERVSLAEDCFLPKAELNALRRECYEDLAAQRMKPRPPLERRNFPPAKAPETARGERILAVIDRDFSDPVYRRFDIAHAVLRPENYADADRLAAFRRRADEAGWVKWLYLPAYLLAEDLAVAEKAVPYFDGVYAQSFTALAFCREKRLRLFAGTGFNLFNRRAADAVLAAGAEEFAVSAELSLRETEMFPDGFVFTGGRAGTMELGHCPFGKACADCGGETLYTMRDERGREFPLARYVLSGCRFEVYNCAVTNAPHVKGKVIADCCALRPEEKETVLSGRDDPRTGAGLLRRGVL